MTKAEVAAKAGLGSAVGGADSEARALAQGLLADCSTTIVYQQGPPRPRTPADVLGLSVAERAQLPDLQVGEGLLRVGQRAFVVRHLVTEGELSLFDTDFRMLRDRMSAEGAAGLPSHPRWRDLGVLVAPKRAARREMAPNPVKRPHHCRSGGISARRKVSNTSHQPSYDTSSPCRATSGRW